MRKHVKTDNLCSIGGFLLSSCILFKMLTVDQSDKVNAVRIPRQAYQNSGCKLRKKYVECGTIFGAFIITLLEKAKKLRKYYREGLKAAKKCSCTRKCTE